MVSCICLTKDRREFLGEAIQSYLRQTYPAKELVIVQDGADISDMAAFSNVRLASGENRATFGEKRNLACELASGEYIAIFDDDDVSLKGRIAEQVATLEQSGRAVTAFHDMRFLDGESEWMLWGTPQFTARGASMMFRRDWWRSNPFPATNIGEDTAFLTNARVKDQLITTELNHAMYQRLHPGNWDRYCPGGHGWQRIF